MRQTNLLLPPHETVKYWDKHDDVDKGELFGISISRFVRWLKIMKEHYPGVTLSPDLCEDVALSGHYTLMPVATDQNVPNEVHQISIPSASVSIRSTTCLLQLLSGGTPIDFKLPAAHIPAAGGAPAPPPCSQRCAEGIKNKEAPCGVCRRCKFDSPYYDDKQCSHLPISNEKFGAALERLGGLSMRLRQLDTKQKVSKSCSQM